MKHKHDYDRLMQQKCKATVSSALLSYLYLSPVKSFHSTAMTMIFLKYWRWINKSVIMICWR